MERRAGHRAGRREGRWQNGFLGHYALALMDRSPVHASQLSARIAEQSRGSWQPGPGAVYPAFRSLVARGLAEEYREEGRPTYRITPAGRRQLRRVREARHRWGERFGGSWRLLLDLVEPTEWREIALKRLRGTLATVETLAAGEEDRLPAADRRRLRAETVRELRRALATLADGRGAAREGA